MGRLMVRRKLCKTTDLKRLSLSFSRSHESEEAAKSFFLVLKSVPRYASSSKRSDGQWQTKAGSHDPLQHSHWSRPQDNLLTLVRWESKVAESFYSTNKVNVRPHSVRVGDSRPATALYFQSPRCVDQKINQIMWALPIETVWWHFLLISIKKVFGEMVESKTIFLPLIFNFSNLSKVD